MAKQPKSTEQAAKVKFRIIEFELEGGDATIQESLKNIATAFARGGTVTSKIARQDSAKQLAESGSLKDIQTDEELDLEDDDVDDVVHQPAAQKRTTSPKKPVTVKVLTEIRFSDVTPTLKEFATGKQPKNELAKYLVIAYWYKNYLDTEDLTIDHFYTAYKFLNWSVPRDPGQAVRDLRHRRRGKFSAGSVTGTSKINHIGENDVDLMGNAQ